MFYSTCTAVWARCMVAWGPPARRGASIAAQKATKALFHVPRSVTAATIPRFTGSRTANVGSGPQRCMPLHATAWLCDLRLGSHPAPQSLDSPVTPLPYHAALSVTSLLLCTQAPCPLCTPPGHTQAIRTSPKRVPHQTCLPFPTICSIHSEVQARLLWPLSKHCLRPDASLQADL